jgi:YidC/Oxa1 family membrane protein insertase
MIHLAIHAAVATATPKSSSSILDPIAKPIADVLAFFYAIVPNYAFAILALSLAWMILISPLTLKTTRSMLAMQKLAPEMARLKEKHRNDRQALNAATMDLYKEHNVSPFGACLPSILPLPVFIALFRVIDGLSHTVKLNGVTYYVPKFLSSHTQMYKDIVAGHGHLDAFGLNLARSAWSSHSSFATALPYYILLLVMMGTQYFQTQMMMSRNQGMGMGAQQNSQMQIMKFMPIIFGLFCLRFPAGVVLYYSMSNVCRISQQFLMYRYDPKVRTLAIKDIKEIEASAHVIDDDDPDTMFNRKSPKPAIGGPAGRSRFRDLLTGSTDQPAAGGRTSTPNKAAPRNGTRPNATTKPGTNGAKPGNNGAKAKPGTSNGVRSTAKPAAGTKPPAPGGKPTSRTRTANAKAAGSPNGNGAIAPRNGSSNGADTVPSTSTPPASNGSQPPASNGSPAPKTGAGTGTGRTGAGGSRTGAQSRRTRRRGR